MIYRFRAAQITSIDAPDGGVLFFEVDMDSRQARRIFQDLARGARSDELKHWMWDLGYTIHEIEDAGK